jgi:hypothetical protein
MGRLINFWLSLDVLALDEKLAKVNSSLLSWAE